MENECKSIIRYFAACIKRIMISKHYIICLTISFICALISIDFLEAVYQTTSFMPKEIFESFKSGEVYNIGLISIRNLDLSKVECFDEIVLGVLSGSFLQCIITAIVSTSICNEYKSGYFEIAITHGQSRTQLFFQYIACSILATIPLISVTIIGVNIALINNGMFVFENITLIIKTVMIQFIMLCALCICISSLTLLMRDSKAIIVNISGVLVLPLMPNYISIFTKGKLNLESILLLNQIINSGTVYSKNIISLILISIVTMTVFILPCMACFRNRNFK